MFFPCSNGIPSLTVSAATRDCGDTSISPLSRPARALVPSVGFAALLVSACYNPSISQCSLRCGSDESCPKDMFCSHGLCGDTPNACEGEGGAAGQAGEAGSGGGMAGGEAGSGMGGGGTAGGGMAGGGTAGGGMGGDAGSGTAGGGMGGDAGSGMGGGGMGGGGGGMGGGGMGGGGMGGGGMGGGGMGGGGMGGGAGTGIAGSPGIGSAGAGGNGTVQCPPGQYLNVRQQLCVPARDLNRDGKSDLLAVNYNGINALISTGTQYTFTQWLAGTFRGPGGAYAADVTGDGYADGVAITKEGDIWVASVGSAGFGTTADTVTQWANAADYPMLGLRGTFIVDVDGDRRADAVMLNEDDVMVSLSAGNHFEPPTVWRSATPFAAYHLWSFFADVNGDGLADAVLVADLYVDVMLSTGTSFGPIERWASFAFPDGYGICVVDVDGDGLADGVRLTDGSVFVMRSNGTRFLSEERWFLTKPLGERLTMFVDADGDGRANLVQINDFDVSVGLSTGTSFASPTRWYTGLFRADVYYSVAPDLASTRAIGPPQH